jgi:hypothetical protein
VVPLVGWWLASTFGSYWFIIIPNHAEGLGLGSARGLMEGTCGSIFFGSRGSQGRPRDARGACKTV